VWRLPWNWLWTMQFSMIMNRRAIAELAESSNNLINLTPVSAGGAEGSS